MIIMNVLYSITLIGEAVFKLRENRRTVHIVMRVALMLLTLANLCMFIRIPIFVLLIIALRSLEQIFRIAFSQIPLSVLRKIIRKTYAAEILLGMLLLIIAFSFLLSLVDTSITSFWDALWFCFATITTIGYGDVSAVSPIGRVLAVILGIYGIIVVALITSVIVNFYNETKDLKDTKKIQ